jgi:hypothetical protein
VRTAKEMVDFFFPRANGVAEDRIFLHIPADVRGPIISHWGIRGAKSAIRDTDEKTRQVVQDALAAGDIDESIFEEGLTPQTLIDWVALDDWWTFWRTGKLTGVAIQKALAVARELALFDDRWFLLNVDGRGGKLKGTDTICDTLSKDQIIAWMRKVHESGDGSPAGLVAALGWETVLSKTSQEALLFALDAFAKKVGLVPGVVPAAPEAPSREVAHVAPVVQAAHVATATEMPSHDGSLAAPDIPADLEPPSIMSLADSNPWGADSATMVTETRATIMSSLADESGAPSWPDVTSKAPPGSEPPQSFEMVEIDPNQVDAKGQPPPVPSVRKRF